MQPKFFVPVADVVASVFQLDPSKIPAWLVTLLVMDEVQHLMLEPLLQDWFECDHVTVSVERASWEFGIDLMAGTRDGGDRRIAAWELLLNHIGVRSIPNSRVWDQTRSRLFLPCIKSPTISRVNMAKIVKIRTELTRIQANLNSARNSIAPTTISERLAKVRKILGPLDKVQAGDKR